MVQTTENFIAYMNKAHSVYHAIHGLKTMLEEQGYICLHEQDHWDLQPGGKYYLTRNGSALIAFRIPQTSPVGFMITASHADRPCFKIKENGELTGTYTRIATEKYGGMLMATWLDRPLSIAGRVMVETETGVESKLLDIDRDLLLIPNVAIHMNRKANEEQSWNPAVDTIPLLSGKEGAGKLDALLEKEAGGKILGHDLFLYVREQASLWGLEKEFISAPALDDLACAWCCTRGFLQAQETDAIAVLSVFDSEEVGSSSLQGADSDLLDSTLHRISKALSLETDCLLHNSFMLSADNAHAIHPNHPEYADAKNAPVLNEGVVLKFNANQKYTTDGLSAALFRKICQKANVPVQTYYNRADLPGGSTLGNISLSHVSIPTADIGLPQLAMHSCYETAGVQDITYMECVMTVFYGSTLVTEASGYALK